MIWNLQCQVKKKKRVEYNRALIHKIDNRYLEEVSRIINDLKLHWR